MRRKIEIMGSLGTWQFFVFVYTLELVPSAMNPALQLGIRDFLIFRIILLYSTKITVSRKQQFFICR